MVLAGNPVASATDPMLSGFCSVSMPQPYSKLAGLGSASKEGELLNHQDTKTRRHRAVRKNPACRRQPQLVTLVSLCLGGSPVLRSSRESLVLPRRTRPVITRTSPRIFGHVPAHR